MSYNICERCGKAWGVINLTLYSCHCMRAVAVENFARALWSAWYASRSTPGVSTDVKGNR